MFWFINIVKEKKKHKYCGTRCVPKKPKKRMDKEKESY